jgi:hypothetical protein
MAKGDITLFEEFIREKGEKIHNFGSDTFRLGLITSVLTPTAADATPRWGDYSANEVATGTSYSAGGPALADVTWTEVAGLAKMDATDLEIDQDATGFTNARWGILYNDTDTSKRAFGSIDLGAATSIQSAPLEFRWHIGGIWKDTVSNP